MTTAKPIQHQPIIDEPIDYDSLEYDPFEPDPMPDAMLQEPILRGLLAVLSSRAQANNPGQHLFDSSNTIVCYDPSNLNVRVSPDYYFAVGIDPETLKYRGIYRTWIQGKPPDFVLEVASPSTARNDETTKRDIYANMGVTEYWRYDPTDLIDPNQRPLYAVPLIGEMLVDGAYQPIEVSPGPEDCIMGFSPALGVSLAVKDKRLWVYDHELGEFRGRVRGTGTGQDAGTGGSAGRTGATGCRGERAEPASRHHPAAGGGTATPAGEGV